MGGLPGPLRVWGLQKSPGLLGLIPLSNNPPVWRIGDVTFRYCDTAPTHTAPLPSSSISKELSRVNPIQSGIPSVLSYLGADSPPIKIWKKLFGVTTFLWPSVWNVLTYTFLLKFVQHPLLLCPLPVFRDPRVIKGRRVIKGVARTS